MAGTERIKKIKDFLHGCKMAVSNVVEPRLKLIKCKIYVSEPQDLFDIPIIINNFNQYDYLLRLIDSLVSRGYRNIHILDNQSTYPPLLEYYKTCPYDVIHLGKNLGYLAFWKSGIYNKFKNQYFVYTDPDLEITEDCPADFMQYFYDILRRNRLTPKVGFSLKIDDIPAHNPQREKIIKWESRFWEDEIEPGLYRAPIDTTFALYRPFTKHTRNPHDNMIRVGPPYEIRHLPWYTDPDNMTPNERFYFDKSHTATHWSGKNPVMKTERFERLLE